MPKGFLCWEGSCHSTSHWGVRRTLNVGSSLLSCCAGCQGTTLGLMDMLLMVKFALLLIPGDMGL